MKRRTAVHEHRLEWIRRHEDEEPSDQDEEATDNGSGKQESRRSAA
ncbi:hypothetical protein GCM10012320_19110 [Sinomonas cellulolyticus]|uniref:Uncharacterized protein n=1 Tax=Sinomonas cellulolyticus TaxID=2801916 RepID=A0ABS1K6Z2_9MICC|nr:MULTISPECIES: hypothetical protein [Sinomonas]MBL0707289.1 hypothetical protein [Sinomonas cellulolyticus]GHG50462.1 hypothetical protein GCM10012320_19110 [Sinomonas sp. KCTC 49339]